jgi:chemotaxis protein methyltransferase CheR
VALASADFELVRTLVYGKSGIVLDDKEYLIESRLSTLAQRNGFGDLGRLLARLRDANGGPLEYKVVEALTTNETLFFRDAHPFDALEKTIIPELLARNAARKHLRIWSAACSTGQEPYSIAMLLRECIPQVDSWKIDILATDISDTVLEQARHGIYNHIEVNRGLPAGRLAKYFEQTAAGWRLVPQIRQMVKFERMNLIGRWPLQQPFHIVLLRNVMIYFDTQLRKTILVKMADQLAPGGYLFMGAGETPVALSNRFEVVAIGRTAVYRLKTT